MIDYFLFDLDNTLYLPQKGPLTEVDRRMTHYMVECFDLTEESAKKTRRHYCLEYGTTMAGLMKDYQIDPLHFLQYVHDIPDDTLPARDPLLREHLLAIEQPKYILTNSYTPYAETVLQALGVDDLFIAVFDVVTMELRNKYHEESYQKIMHLIQNSAHPHQFIMFDDLWPYLSAAKNLGLTTVLVSPDFSGEPDFHLQSIHHLSGLYAHLY